MLRIIIRLSFNPNTLVTNPLLHNSTFFPPCASDIFQKIPREAMAMQAMTKLTTSNIG